MLHELREDHLLWPNFFPASELFGRAGTAEKSWKELATLDMKCVSCVWREVTVRTQGFW
jgi:hypothetical protein